MDKTKITNFIQQARQQGTSDEEIVSFLKSKGVDLQSGTGIKELPKIQQNIQTPPTDIIHNTGDTIVKTAKEGIDQAKQGFKQTQDGAKNPNILEGFGQIARGTLNELGGGLSTIFSPVTGTLHEATKLPIVKDIVGAIKNHVIDPSADSISNYKPLQEFMVTHPNADEIAGNLITVALTLAGAKKSGDIKPIVEDTINKTSKIVENSANTVADIGQTAKDSAVKVVDTVKERLSDKSTADELAGRISQAKPEDIPAVKNALGSVDTTGVNTFKDLSTKFEDAIKSNTKEVDVELDKATNTLKPKDVTKTLKVKGGKSIKSDFVKDGLAQLETYYEKTNSPENVVRIKELTNKYKKTGLTPKEINVLAREHGSNLNGFNANGELASGLSKQAAENTRTGLKNIARDAMPDAGSKAIDANTTDLIKAKELIDNMDKKVGLLENKIRDTGIIQKAGKFIGKIVDVTTGGFLKGALKTITGIGEGKSTMSAIEIQDALASNLKKIDKIIKEKDPAKIEAQLKEIFKDYNPSE